jgi:glycogen debranching enzyme
MPIALVRPEDLYAWYGPALLICDRRGTCGEPHGLSGFYYREARFLRTLRLEIDGTEPWLCESASVDPRTLTFNFIYPELTTFGGGGSGQSGDEETADERGIPHRALALRLTYRVGLADLSATLTVANHASRSVECDVAWTVDADFADIQEAPSGNREQTADVDRQPLAEGLAFLYRHAQLPYRAQIQFTGTNGWTFGESRARTHLRLQPQESVSLALRVEPRDETVSASTLELSERENHLERWRNNFARVEVPRNRIAEQIIGSNIRDLASFAMCEGNRDEWLTLQAGMPLYPAIFGRDTVTAGWQVACLDRGQSLDASLTFLGRLQSDRIDDWRDEEPGRIPYQIRRGPLALLDLNPYSAYYADFASPLMFVISLAHLYAWTGEKRSLERHWDVARRILDWANTYGDKDRDGYLEYQTRSSKGTKNQGWKDSGDAIIYDDGRPVPSPIATCEVQGYWFAAQQAMAVMSWAMGARDDARAYWRSARELKARFNRDWWVEEEEFVALALDPEKQQVRAVTSNAGHCLASGIIDDEHLPPVVGRLFAPDMFSGWGIRTLSARHAAYNPLSYHRGTVWAVEQSTIVFGLRRFGFDARALELAQAMFELAQLYPEYRIPECVGGTARGDSPVPGAYPRANTPQLWNASAFPLLVHVILGLQPVAPLELLVIDPVLPTWLPEVILRDLRIAGARATLRFWRDRNGKSHGEVLDKRGTLRVVRQPPPESLSAGVGDRLAALIETLIH